MDGSRRFAGFIWYSFVSLEMLSHLAALRSLGVAYLSPVTPLNIRGLRDTFIRAPLWAMDSRPASLDSPDTKRQSSGQMPRPPKSTPSRGILNEEENRGWYSFC